MLRWVFQESTTESDLAHFPVFGELNMAADPELLAALKMAKGKKMFFAYIPKGPADGKLIVSKVKIPPKDIAAAKKELSGGTPITGKCMGSPSDMMFTTVKPAPGTLAAAIKIVTKRDAGLPVIATFQLAADADVEEGEAPEKGGAPAAAAPPAAPPPAPPPSLGNLKGIQTALKKAGYDPGTIDGVNGPKTEAAVKKFQKDHGLAADGIAGPKTQAALAKALAGGAPGAAPSGDAGASSPPAPPPPPAPPAGAPPAGTPQIDLGPWQNARQNAINNLKSLAAKVAATKHGDAAGVVKEISAIIAKLPAVPAPQAIDQLEAFIMKDEAITAAEQSPKHFHDLNIRGPLLQALAAMKQ
jgi:peptidoglycan hydrolase-like protein with peptidoglycan-binding domain